MTVLNKTFLFITLIISGVVFSYDSNVWDSNIVRTTTKSTGNATSSSVNAANALNTINSCALASDCSSITVSDLTTAGASSVYTSYLSAYQTALAAESSIANTSALQSIVDTTNTSSSPSVANAISSATAATEDVAYSYTIPSNVFSGTGTLTYTGSISGSSGLTYSSGVISGTPTVPGTYTVTYSVTDAESQTASTTFSIVVANVNDAPVLGADITASIAENSTSGSIGTITATDDDSGDTITYSISAGNTGNNFEIDSSTGAITVASSATLDYETTTSYTLTITASDGTLSDTATATVSVTDVVETQQIADTISGSGSVTVADLTAVGVSSSVTSDLTNNNNCGSDGATNCLTEFNSAKASTACTALPNSGATNAQISTFVNCVMRESNVAQATAISAAQTATASSGASCQSTDEPISMGVPTTCSHSQWSCSLVGDKTPSTGYTLNAAGTSLNLAHAYNGTPSSASYTIRTTLGIYSPAYTRDYTYTVAIPGTPPTTTVTQHNFSGKYGKAWNNCLQNNSGRVLATKSQILSHKGWGSNWPSSTSSSGGISRIIYNAGEIEPDYNSWGSCSYGSITPQNKVKYKAIGGSDSALSLRGHGTYTSSHPYVSYLNASDTKTNHSSCKWYGASGTATYFCATQAYTCPSD